MVRPTAPTLEHLADRLPRAIVIVSVWRRRARAVGGVVFELHHERAREQVVHHSLQAEVVRGIPCANRLGRVGSVTLQGENEDNGVTCATSSLS